jgi:hypothetical protein
LAGSSPGCLTPLSGGFLQSQAAINGFRTYKVEGIHLGVSKVIGVIRALPDVWARFPALKFPGFSDLVKIVADGAAAAGCYSGCRGASNYWGCVDSCLKDEICAMK